MAVNYERVKLDELRQGRRGKHHELIEGILSDFASLPDGQAIKIPLSQVKGVSLAHLRAAVSRAASSRSLEVATVSDDANFYVWKRTKKSAQHERKIKRDKSYAAVLVGRRQ